jgi:hypothetical protein
MWKSMGRAIQAVRATLHAGCTNLQRLRRGGIVEHHASERYEVLGEGLLTASAGGRKRPFRFSRMGPKGAPLEPATLELLAEAMTRGGGGAGDEESDIPAGFTYLGQFIAHDLSFDRTDVTLGSAVTVDELVQNRSPSLDLDSLYGAGPKDPESEKFYRQDGVKLRVGETAADGGFPARRGYDLPRQNRKAVIPDERNDENVAVAQTHLAFIRFHNRVVDAIDGTVPAESLFRKARELVTKHYQWMIREDYLTRVCSESVVADVFGHGRKAFEVGVDPKSPPTMPIEFSIGTFRLGHAMVRSAYSWNRKRDLNVTLDELFRHSGKGGDLGGKDRLSSTMIADFRRLYDFGPQATFRAAPGRFNRAMRIDTRLVKRLSTLATGTFGGPPVPPGDPEANLAFRNLTRAEMVKLATGQQMAARLQRAGVSLTPLTKQQIVTGHNGAELDRFTPAQLDELVAKTPLWFYVLREAELNGGKLEGVGARIMAETFHRAIEGSRVSIVRDTDWKPKFGRGPDSFKMVDLLRFAYENDAGMLAPLG